MAQCLLQDTVFELELTLTDLEETLGQVERQIAEYQDLKCGYGDDWEPEHEALLQDRLESKANLMLMRVLAVEQVREAQTYIDTTCV